MDTHNKSFNDAWEYLKEYHPVFDLQGETLDLSVKPKVSKSQYPRYMSAIITILKIGYREGFITTHLDGYGYQVYIKSIV